MEVPPRAAARRRAQLRMSRATPAAWRRAPRGLCGCPVFYGRGLHSLNFYPKHSSAKDMKQTHNGHIIPC